MEIFIDILGYVALAFLGLSFFMKKRIGIIILQVIANLFFIAHYVVMGIFINDGAYSAALCNIAQFIMLFVFAYCDYKKLKKFIPGIFIGVLYGGLLTYGYVMLIGYGQYVSLISVVASTIGISGFFSSKKFVIKILGIISDSIWLTYGILISDLPTILTNSILLFTTTISLIIGIVQYYNLKKDLEIKKKAEQTHNEEGNLNV